MHCFICNRRVRIDFLHDAAPKNMIAHGAVCDECLVEFRALQARMKKIPEKELEVNYDSRTNT